MSENLEDLLDVDVDEENEGDYDLGDDEEDALLDDDYEVSGGKRRAPATSKGRGDQERDHEPEPDFVLELDDGTELNDEDDAEISLNASSNIDEEHERNRKTDKFTSERVVPSEVKSSIQNDGKFFGNKQYQRAPQSRGRGRGGGGGGGRGYHQNEQQSRYAQYHHQKKKVLINPHFKGNVQIRNNVSLAWDSNHVNNQSGQQHHKKSYMYIHPWAAQNQQPVLNTFAAQQPELLPVINTTTFGNPPSYHQTLPTMNHKPPVHQRLGINPNFCNAAAVDNNNQQYVQFPPQQPFQQIPPHNAPPPSHMYEPQHFTNFNSAVPPHFHGQQQMFQQKLPPVYNQPPIYNNHYPQHTPAQQGNYNAFQPHANNPLLDYGVYPHHVPTQNVDVDYQRAEFAAAPHPKQYHQPQRKYGQGSPGKRKFDNFVKGGDPKKKKQQRNPSSNLHEVQTVDVAEFSDKSSKIAAAAADDEEDEEMRAYRLKIEQQKLVREKILRQKEERRKQAAKKMQAEEEYETVVPPNELIKSIEIIPVVVAAGVQQEVVVVKKKKKKMAATTSLRAAGNVVHVKTERVAAATAASSSPRKDEEEEEPPEPFHLNAFLNNRKIFAKDQSLADTPVVVVKNLASGTSVAKLRKLCQGVGDIQNLQMSTQERQATIQFKSVASAHAFYKKYQRFMLDLSMIQVTLKTLS